MKKAFAVILAVWMLVCLFPFAGTAADAAVTVAFDNDLRGSAAGVYKMTVPGSGKYALYWGASDGQRLTAEVGEQKLSYTALYEFETKKETTETFEPQSFTAIPYGAAKLLLTRAGETVATFDVPESKKLEKAQNYAYGLLSDLHFNTYEDSAGKDESIGAVDAALAYFKAAGVKYVFETGDISTNADETAYQHFADCVERGGLTFLACGGNHEVVSGYDKMYGENGLFYKYVNKGVYDGTLEGVLEIAPDGHDFVYQIPGTNDLFIAISQVRWDSKLPTMKPLVEPETITWFEEMLDKYAGKKIHLLMHTFLSDDDYDHVDGEGDISNKAGFGYAYYWNIYSEEDARLRAIFDSHEDLIWYNGHSHWIIEMQKYNKNLNIYDYEGTTSTLVHVPSVTAPRTVDDNDTSYHSNVGKRSEGLLMFSCDGYEIENAINFKTGEIYAFGCYIIYDRATKTERGKAGEKAEYVFDRQLSSLRFTGEGAIDASDASWMRYADGIRSVYVSKGVEKIGDGALKDLTALRRIEIKEGVSAIGAEAFSGCRNVKELILPESLASVKKNAFSALGSDTVQGKPAVTFGGTPEEFKAIRVSSGNDALTGATCLKRTVTWRVGEYVRREILPVGTVPSYGGAAVSPCETEGKYFTFVGWNNGKRTFTPSATLPKLTDNAEYTAVFGKEDDRYVTGQLTEKITWTFDQSTGTLILSGSGPTPNFSSKDEKPWDEYKDRIYTVVVKTGVRTMGNNLLSHHDAMHTLIVEDGIKTFGGDCFAYNGALTDIYIPSSVIGVSQGACYTCDALKNIYYSGTEEQWATFQSRLKTSYNEVLRDASDVQVGTSAPTLSDYTVTFVDDEGAELSKISGVKWGEGVIAPAAPEKQGKTFVGYDAPYFLVTGDMTVRAVYDAIVPTPEETLAAMPFGVGEFIIAAALRAA
ncbi:MAG: leucine-rich repeat protein [Clostridia bacterium]|nr:leucine-rich repeat protein [Clostridia bacterium]